ncbi:FlgB family protein [Algirhabdus cladophorae]|uniref:FlgB family protein n=1 Tax=Algirhabdus cladophorae TaxID=3377108 RepID=UPI003B8462BE
MYKNLKVFEMSSAMAQHATARHAIVAQNIANSDTPGYRAKDVASFAQTLDAGTLDSSDFAMFQSRKGHLQSSATVNTSKTKTFETPSESLNGNSVSLELEMVKSIESQRQHDRAISIYKNALTVLRTSLGRN